MLEAESAACIQMKLAWLKMHNPPALLDEVKNFMEAVTARGLDLSLSTYCRELERLGMTRKKMQYFSCRRDETDRVNFWCNSPNHPYRPGVFGLSYLDIIDLDEAPDVEFGIETS